MVQVRMVDILLQLLGCVCVCMCSHWLV